MASIIRRGPGQFRARIRRAGLARALAHAERSGDRAQIGWANYYIAWALHYQQRLAEAVPFAQAATRDFRGSGDREGLPNALMMQALLRNPRVTPHEVARIARTGPTRSPNSVDEPPQLLTSSS